MCKVIILGYWNWEIISVRYVKNDLAVDSSVYV